MNRQQLIERSEQYLRELLRASLPAHTPVHLFGSRARRDARWNSDYDLWIDCNLDPMTLNMIAETIEESFVPFGVDIITTPQLKGKFGALVHKEAMRWM